MAKTQVLLDTNLLYRTGQLQVLLDLEERGVLELNISSITAYSEYKKNYEQAWRGINAKRLDEMKRIGSSVEQEKLMMQKDFEKESRVISRIKVLDVTEEEGAAFNIGVKDKSDRFLGATAQKHGIKNILSGDKKAVDKEELKKAGINFTEPGQFLAAFTYMNQPAMARIFYKDIKNGRTFPPALNDFDKLLRSSIENVKAGKVFVIDHPRAGHPVEAYWRAAPVAA